MPTDVGSATRNAGIFRYTRYSMRRKPRLDLDSVPQHIIQRGNDLLPCFFTDADYQRYPVQLREISLREGCRIHAMP